MIDMRVRIMERISVRATFLVFLSCFDLIRASNTMQSGNETCGLETCGLETCGLETCGLG